MRIDIEEVERYAWLIECEIGSIKLTFMPDYKLENLPEYKQEALKQFIAAVKGMCLAIGENQITLKAGKCAFKELQELLSMTQT